MIDDENLLYKIIRVTGELESNEQSCDYSNHYTNFTYAGNPKVVTSYKKQNIQSKFVKTRIWSINGETQWKNKCQRQTRSRIGQYKSHHPFSVPNSAERCDCFIRPLKYHTGMEGTELEQFSVTRDPEDTDTKAGESVTRALPESIDLWKIKNENGGQICQTGVEVYSISRE